MKLLVCLQLFLFIPTLSSAHFPAHENLSRSYFPSEGIEIKSHPLSQSVCENAEVTLSVEITSPCGVEYQWYRNDVALDGETSATLTFQSGARDDGASFYVAIIGSCGRISSEPAMLSFISRPVISLENATACEGETYTFSASIENAVSYQWYKNNEPIAGTATYVIPSLSEEDAGGYKVNVQMGGDCNYSVGSEEVYLDVRKEVEVVSITESITLCEGETAEMVIEYRGGTEHEWYKNGVPTGIHSNWVEVENPSNGDTYYAVIVGFCNTLVSPEIRITVIPKVSMPLNITSTKPAGICQGDSATLSVSGCVEDITWYRGNENVGTGGVYQAFTAGIYSVKCKNSALLADSATIEVADRSVVAYTVSSADVSCFGGTNGSIHIEAEGPVQWVSAPALSGNNPGNLPVGAYHFVVMNSAGCSVSDSVILSQPEKIPVNYSLKNLSCFGSNDGGITIDVSNTNPEPVYKLNGVTGHWSNGHINALIAGTYTIEVQDARGCHLLLPTLVTLTEPERLTFSLIESKEPTGYESTDGYMEVEISGGTGPYTVVWTDETGNSRASQDYYSGNNLRTRIFNLDKGHYRVNVTDQNPCEATAYYELNAPAPIVITSLADSITCYGNANGRISLQVEGGVKDGSTIGYQIEWKLEGQTIGSNTLQLAGLKAGTYTVQVTDAGGIVASKTIVLGEPAPMSLAVIRLSGNYCSNLAVGEMDLQATGGKLPYTYFYNELESASPLLKGLSGGDYSLRVRDSAGCEAEVTATIENTQQEFKASLTYTQPSCYGACDGTVSAQVMGGIAPFIYQWNEFPGDSATVTGVCAGGETYFTVRDANGCEVSSELLPLSGPAPKTLSLPSELEVCPSDFELDASSLEWGRRFVWTFPDGSSVSGAKVKGDSLGVYRVEVLDQESCGGVGQIRVIARKNIHPMFTLPNEAQTHREVVMIDLSEPYPSAIEWVLPPSATRSAQGDFEARAVFSQTGRFVVRQRATIEGCVYTTSKEIRISDAVPDDGFSPPVSFTDIDFKVLGNPVVHGVLNLEINNPSAESYRVRVFAASGFRKVYEADFTGEKSRNLKISLPEEEADGLFYVTIETPAYRKTRKVLRIK